MAAFQVFEYLRDWALLLVNFLDIVFCGANFVSWQKRCQNCKLLNPFELLHSAPITHFPQSFTFELKLFVQKKSLNFFVWFFLIAHCQQVQKYGFSIIFIIMEILRFRSTSLVHSPLPVHHHFSVIRGVIAN